MNSYDLSHKNIRITGRVQGVGFRYTARNVAWELGVNGFIRNLSNGEVYIEVEGPLSQIDEFIAWCREGPPRARIDHLDVTEGAVVGFREFIIR